MKKQSLEKKSLKDIITDHPIVTFLTVFVSVLAIIGFFKKNEPSDQYFSAHGTILSSDSTPIPKVIFLYSLDGKQYLTDSADEEGNYTLLAKMDKPCSIRFKCRYKEDSNDSHLWLGYPDVSAQNIKLTGKNVIGPPSVPKRTISKETDPKKSQEKQLFKADTTARATRPPVTETHAQDTIAMIPFQEIKLPEYELKRDNEDALIPYFSENTNYNDHVDNEGFLDYQTHLTTLPVPSESNRECVYFAFFDKRKNKPAKGWVKLQNLRLKTH